MQYPNRVKGLADTGPELLLKNWNTINERVLVRSQLGAAFDTIIEWVVNNDTIYKSYNPTPSMFNRVKPGNISGTFLEPYRNQVLVNISEEAIPKVLNCFPFSFFKADSDPEDYSDLNDDIIDPGTYVGLVFNAVNLIYSFAPKGIFYSCKFKKCNLRNSDWTARSIESCLFEDCNMEYMKLMDSDVTVFDQDPMYFYSTFRRCVMNNIEAARLATSNCLFEDCLINNANLDTVDGNTWSEYTTFRRCEIINTVLGLGKSANLSTIFEDCEVKNSTLTGIDTDNYGGIIAENTDFENSTIIAAQINGKCINSSFKNVTFSPAGNGGVEIEDANIKGSDFTGSNLDDFYATKQDLIDAGNTYDENTLWVDGTPLGA